MTEYISNNDELDDLFSDLKNDPEFQEAMDKLEPGYQITNYRLEKGLTQAGLADLAGTSQSSIARLENGSSPPSLSFLRRVAKAMGAKVQVKITSNDQIDREAEDNRVFLDTIKYIHNNVLEDILKEKFLEANQKLTTLVKIIEKCQPSQELELLSEVISNEKEMIDLLSVNSDKRPNKEYKLYQSASLVKEYPNKYDTNSNTKQYYIKGIGAEYADLLEEAGVRTIPELAGQNYEFLYLKLQEVNQTKNLVQKFPTKEQVTDWIEQAKTVPLEINLSDF